MVYHITVANQPFTLSDEAIAGSTTITNLLDYSRSAAQQIIPVNVDLNDWYSYLDFLNAGQPTVEALKVIDYLDNVPQARQWCQLWRQQQQTARIDPDEFVITRAVIQDEIDKELITLINKQTEFETNQVIPFRSLQDFNDILARINSPVKEVLTAADAQHIVSTLFHDDIVTNYNWVANHGITSLDPKQLHFLLVSNLFIIELEDAYHTVHKSDFSILDRPPIDYYTSHDKYQLQLFNDVELISTRVALHYPKIRTYYVGNRERLLYCPDDKSYLHYSIMEGTDYDTLAVVCRSTPALQYNADIELIENQSDVSLGNYVPRQGYQTGVKLANQNGGNYDVISYNPVSNYGRNFYIFLPYEYDPIARVVYVFSV